MVLGLRLLFGCWICDCGMDICYGSWLESTQSFDYKEEFSDHEPGCHEVWGWGLNFNMVWVWGLGFFMHGLGFGILGFGIGIEV